MGPPERIVMNYCVKFNSLTQRQFCYIRSINWITLEMRFTTPVLLYEKFNFYTRKIGAWSVPSIIESKRRLNVDETQTLVP